MRDPDLPFRTHRRVGGLDLRVEWDGSALAGAVEATLGYLGPEAAPGADPLVLRLSALGPPLAVPAGAEAVGETPEGLRALRHDGALWLRFRETVAHVEPARGVAHVAVAEGAGPLRDALVYSLFFYAAAALLDCRGRRTAHAACLVRDGGGLLVVGESDSGKSTLTMRLVEAGWGYLTDDSVVLGAGGELVRAWPLRRDFCLDPEAEALFPSVAAHWEPHLADARKRRFRVRELYPDGAAASCVPRAVVFPQVVDADEGRLVPLSAQGLLLGLLRHTGAPALAAGGGAAPHLDALRQLAGQSRGYALRAGRDLRDDPAAAERLLRPLVGGAERPSTRLRSLP